MNLKVTKIQELYHALALLDGIDKVVNIDGKDKVVKVPFEFTGKVRWNITKNRNVLRRELEGFDKVRDELINQISEGTGMINPDEKEKVSKFESEINSVLRKEEEVRGLMTFHESDFNLDKNAIPGAALEALDPLIVCEPSA